MTSSRPYLLRALHEWVLENNLTPYVVVDASLPGVDVPKDFVSNGQIVLNISPGAVRGLHIGNEYLEFNARFGGVPMQVIVPILAVMAVYAKENGQGMVFGAEPGGHPPTGEGKDKSGKSKAGEGKEKKESTRPALKVVK
ncbi:MAG: ClpXP protease specificity-enhancing factor [Hahellaceae bacterium]|nr:ClpXP protease specificity-enhancing factor [Hahellaceae bacterium]